MRERPADTKRATAYAMARKHTEVPAVWPRGRAGHWMGLVDFASKPLQRLKGMRHTRH